MVAVDDLRTLHLHLTRPREADLDDLTGMHGNPRVMATLGGAWNEEGTRNFLRETLAHWDKHGFGLWVMRDVASDEFVGRGGLVWVQIEGKAEVNVAYALRPEFWGRGLATELAGESVRVAFAQLGCTDLVCFALPANRASRRVMEKVGFRYERDILWKGLQHVLYRLRREP